MRSTTILVDHLIKTDTRYQKFNQNIAPSVEVGIMKGIYCLDLMPI